MICRRKYLDEELQHQTEKTGQGVSLLLRDFISLFCLFSHIWRYSHITYWENISKDKYCCNWKNSRKYQGLHSFSASNFLKLLHLSMKPFFFLIFLKIFFSHSLDTTYGCYNNTRGLAVILDQFLLAVLRNSSYWRICFAQFLHFF